MKLLSELEQSRSQTEVILGLTRAFEGIASMRIAQVKDQAKMSEHFFADLWQIYTQIRVNDFFHYSKQQLKSKQSPKELLVLITSEGSLSGDIDERLVSQALASYSSAKNDIIVIGLHGAQLLTDQRIKYKRSFQLPKKDLNVNVQPLLAEVERYASTTVFYTHYISIMVQEIRTIGLAKALIARGQKVVKGSEVISEKNYIFEPSTVEVVSYLEHTMLQVMLSELILESKLAQYASRFRAMTEARQKATDSLNDITWTYNRSKRRLKDERLKHTINSLGKIQL